MFFTRGVSLMKKNLMIAAGFVTSLLVVGVANAATQTTTFQVTATVVANCKIVSAGTVAFGNYSPTAGDVSATSDIVVRCSKNAPYTLGLNGGTTTGGTVAQRLMANGANTLQYNLYKEVAYTNVWGNTAGSDTVSGTGAGLGVPNAITHTVYGLLPDNAFNQDVAVGSYSDTVTATLTY
jgi:spore coat protein U-like protein